MGLIRYLRRRAIQEKLNKRFWRLATQNRELSIQVRHLVLDRRFDEADSLIDKQEVHLRRMTRIADFKVTR